MAEEEAATLEFTPTWVVAFVCSVIIAISFAVERGLHYAGKPWIEWISRWSLKKNNQKPLFEALQKVKEELMILGFISLLLTVFQGFLSKICVSEDKLIHMLPCSPGDREESSSSPSTSEHYSGTLRRLLSSGSESQTTYCSRKDKVPFISTEALHHLHIFIFVLAIVHVTFSALTILFGGAKIRQWKRWEDAIAKDAYDPAKALKPKITHVQQHEFIRSRFSGFGDGSAILSWVHSFFKQFYASVTKSDYAALRLGFITTHCRENRKFNFHRYMIRALEDDFRRVVGISWYLWMFVVIFMLLNVNGWHTYFWIAFLPFFLLLAVGTKLEHVISQLAHEVAEKHAAIEGELVVKPSDEHFWFDRPRFVLFLIHFILFQNAFEMAYLFWIWVQYGFGSCIMDKVAYIIPRVVMGVIIQVLCSYSTLPLYAIVTQMGSHFKRAIFEEHVQVHLLGWAEKAKKNKGLRAATAAAGNGSNSGDGSKKGSGVELGRVFGGSNTTAATGNKEIEPSTAP